MKLFQVLCLCIMGLVTLAMGQDDDADEALTADFGRRVISSVRTSGNKRRSIPTTENPIYSNFNTIQDDNKNIKEPLDYTAQEQQYYIEPVTPTTSTVRPTFKRRKTNRPIQESFSQKKKEETQSDNNNNEPSPGTGQEQPHFNPFKQVVNTNFSKRRPSVGRTRTRAPNNEITSTTTEGHEQRPPIKFSVSSEIDHNNESNNPSAFGLRGQSFREDEMEDKSIPVRSPFRPSAQSQKRKFTPSSSRTPAPKRKSTTNTNDKSALEITYENENATNNQNQGGRRKFVLRPKHRSTQAAGVVSSTTEGPEKPQRRRKRPSFLRAENNEQTESKSSVVVSPPERQNTEVPRARSVDGGRRRKTTSFSPPTQRHFGSEVNAHTDNLPTAAPLILSSPNFENRNIYQRRNQPIVLKTPGVMVDFSDRTTTGGTTDYTSAFISTYPSTSVTELDNILVTDVQPLLLFASSSPKPSRSVHGRSRGPPRSRGLSQSATPQTVPAVEASASSNAPVVVLPPVEQPENEEPEQKSGAKQMQNNFFPNRKNIFDMLQRKQATMRLLSPKPKSLKNATEATNVVDVSSPPPRKITSLTQQNLKKRIPGITTGGLLNRKLQKEIVSEAPPQQAEGGEDTSEVIDDVNNANVNPEIVSEAPAPVGIRNLTMRRKQPSPKPILGTQQQPTQQHQQPKPEAEKLIDNANEAPNGEEVSQIDNAEGDQPPNSPLSKIRKLPTRAPIIKNRLVITTAAPSVHVEEPTHVACEANQRYSKFLKRCVTQYSPKSLGHH